MMGNLRFDPVSLEIIWGRLIGIVDEAATALVRTAFSTIVAESNDYACVLFDDRGLSLAQSSWSVPSFIGTMPITLRACLERFPVESWMEGDVVITNNPWIGTGHFPDVTLFTPIFIDGRILGFTGATVHMSDIGGSALSVDCRDVFEEGLHIPICRMHRAGEPNEAVLDFIIGNVRTPDLVMGDLDAQIAASRVMADRVRALVREEDMSGLRELADELHGRSEQAMRSAIEAIPDGSYPAEVWLDGYDEPLRLAITASVQGSSMLVDYEGTSPQAKRGLNSVLNYTRAYTMHALKCVLNPEVPNNEGSFRPVTVTAPERTLVNPEFPAPVTARNIVGHYINAVVFQALAPAVPDLVIAESGAPANRSTIRGVGFEGENFSYLLFCTGGMGAGRYQDGLSCTAFPTNGGAAPVEVTEARFPILFLKKEMPTDSGGAGQYRGGLGQEVIFQILPDHPVTLSPLTDRIHHPPQGFLGGLPGAAAVIEVDGQAIPPKSKTYLQGGERVRIVAPGGGGYGAPKQRARHLVLQDLENELISPVAARDLYEMNGLLEESES